VVVVDTILVPLDQLEALVDPAVVVEQIVILVIIKEVELLGKEILVEEVDFLQQVLQLAAAVAAVLVLLVTQGNLMGLV
jgi:hypothetical protein